MMVRLLPMLAGLIFMIMILWGVWKIILAVSPSLRRKVELFFGSDLDDLEEKTLYKVLREEKERKIAEKIKEHKKKKANQQKVRNEIKEFLDCL